MINAAQINLAILKPVIYSQLKKRVLEKFETLPTSIELIYMPGKKDIVIHNPDINRFLFIPISEMEDIREKINSFKKDITKIQLLVNFQNKNISVTIFYIENSEKLISNFKI